MPKFVASKLFDMISLTTSFFLDNKKNIKIIHKNILDAINITEKTLNINFDQLTIYIAKDKKQYDKLLKIKRQPWGVTTHKEGVIYLYDPFLWKKKSTGHNLSNLKSSLIHELVHVYMWKKHITSPLWFEEGVAVKISEPNQNNKNTIFNKLIGKYPIPMIIDISLNFKILSSPLDLMFYLTFFMFISYLFRAHSHNKMIQFVKSLENNNNFETQFTKFLKINTLEAWLDFVKYMEYKYHQKINFSKDNDYYFKFKK